MVVSGTSGLCPRLGASAKPLSTSMPLLASRVPRAAALAGSKAALIACGAASGIAAGSFGPIADAPEEVASMS